MLLLLDLILELLVQPLINYVLQGIFLLPHIGISILFLTFDCIFSHLFLILIKDALQQHWVEDNIDFFL